MSVYRYLNLVFRHQHNYNQAVDFLKNGTVPTSLGLKHDLLDKLALENNELVYKPDQLIILPPDEINMTIRAEYGDMKKSLGIGPDKFYEVIRDTYGNVSRKAIREFLKNEPNYQVTRQYRKVVNKPVLAKRVNERWMIDLVDLNQFQGSNNGYRYILTCVDVFTRYLWCRALKLKEANLVRDAMVSISNDADAKPSVLQSDQGKEFRGEVEEWCDEHDISHAMSKSYSPQAQGLLEGINKLVRRKLSDAMVRHNTRMWTNYLQDACESWNITPHGQQKHSPLYLYHGDEEEFAEERKEALDILKKRARKAVARNKSAELSVGDIVRVALAAVSTQVREQIKTARTSKNLVVKWTPELYRIKSLLRINPKGERELPEAFSGLQKRQYTLESLDGQPLRTERLLTDRANLRRREGRFFASELQLVAKKGDKIPDNAKMPYDMVSRLNRLDDGGRIKDKEPRRRRRERTPERQREPTPPPQEEYSIHRSTRSGRRRDLTPPPQQEEYSIHRSTRSGRRK
jgi:hypothetical protein